MLIQYLRGVLLKNQPKKTDFLILEFPWVHFCETFDIKINFVYFYLLKNQPKKTDFLILEFPWVHF